MDPFMGAAFAGLGVMFLLAAVLPLLLMGVALLYVALRVRDAKAEVPDPDLGLKTAYWFLYSLGLLVIHFGLTTLFSYWFQTLGDDAPPQQFGRPGFRNGMPDSWNPAARTGWAFVVAGGVIAAAFYALGAIGTRDREWPTVRRVFTGARLALAGLFAVFAFLFLMVLQFQRETPPGGILPTTLAMLAVWVPSLAVHIFLFRWGGTPAYHVPPPPEPPRRRPARRYDEDDTESPRSRPTDETEDVRRLDDDDDEERPRRRRPRDDD